MAEVPVWAVLLLGVGGICWLIVLALLPNEDLRRRYFGHLLWGILFLYPGFFAVYSGRSVYSGTGTEVPVSAEISNLALIATGLVAVLALTVVLLEFRRPDRGTAGVVIAGVAFAVSSEVSAVAEGNSPVDLHAGFLVLLLVGVYFLGEDATVVISRARVWLRGYVLVSLTAGLLVSSWALVPPEFGGRSWLPTRLIGLTSSTNYMALIAGLAVVLEIVNMNRSRRWRLYSSIALIACVWAQGRTGLAVAAFGAFVLVLHARGRIIRTTLRVAMLISLAIGVVFQLMFTQELAAVQRQALDDFSTGRLEAWGYAWGSFLQSPVFGYGSGFFENAFWVEIPGESNRYANAHNQMLQTLGETGVLGAVAIMVLLWTLFHGAFRRSEATQGASVALLSVIVIQLPFGAPLAFGPLTWGLIPFLLCFALTVSTDSSALDGLSSRSSIPASGGKRRVSNSRRGSNTVVKG